MRILGIDPGYAILGWGVIDMAGNAFHAVDYGAVTTEAGTPMPRRLQHLYRELMHIIDVYHPQAASIEELFFNNNAKTAIHVGQARGVAVLACVNHDLPIGEYTPPQIRGTCRLRQSGKKAGAAYGQCYPGFIRDPQTG